MGTVFEFKLEICTAKSVQNYQRKSLKDLKPSLMNKFQRSLNKKKLSISTKDTTANVAEFLETTLKLLTDFLQGQLFITERWTVLKKMISTLLFIWWETFYQVTSSNFREETFQAHLWIVRDLINKIRKPEFSLIQKFKDIMNKNFFCELNLLTGQSMEVMWRKMRSEPIPNLHVFNTLCEMEDLALRFDALRWIASNNISDLGNIMKYFVEAYHQVLTSSVDGNTLITSLSQEMKSLENNVGREEENVTPFFEQLFDIIRQYQVLSKKKHISSATEMDFRTLILSNQSTFSSLDFCSATASSRPFQIINYLWGTYSELSIIRNDFCPLLIGKLKSLNGVKLRGLRLLEYELPILCQNLSLLSSMLSQDQILNLNTILVELVQKIVEIHGESALKFWKDLCSKNNTSFNMALPDSTISSNLAEIFKNHFLLSIRSIESITSQSNFHHHLSAQAWIEFAIGCIKLFVPDRLYDPDKKQRLELQQHATIKDSWSQKLLCLQKFEHIFTGQDTNLRCNILESDIKNLGEPHEILQDIYRPECSEISCLQEEFRNVLKIVLEPNMITSINNAFQNKDDESSEVVKLFQANINQIIFRLNSKYQAYKDLTRPVVCMLRSLQIGLSIFNIKISSPQISEKKSSEVENSTPFIFTNDLITPGELMRDYPLAYLATIATGVLIEGRPILQTDYRHNFLKTVHELFNVWKTQLENDLSDVGSRSGLYRYRGSFEDENESDNEQLEELFPSSESESSKMASGTTKSEIRETAVELVSTHEEIFFGSGRPVERLKSLMKRVSICIYSTLIDKGNYAHVSQTSTLLPMSILLLDDRINEYSESVNPASYNFYTDPNLPECRKLVSLIHQIQDRYHELQKIDEIGHMQCLQDVLTSCYELLQFCHTDPLAKIITKLEKVHAFMHEWEFGGWASNVRKCPKLFEDIRTTLINWRRLELSTWAKLFDREFSKCEDDAKSWWFIAYQITIAAPLQISESVSEMKNYTEKILIELETYFSSAILGQFSQRLKLLKQLNKHIKILQLDVPSMSIILKALTNFVDIYSRYEKPVIEYLGKERSKLDKIMRDVFLMASWKDTNILALRDSSRRSHYKLFKIVKRFRLLLNQPIQNFLVEGLPDERLEENHIAEKPSSFFPSIDPSALAICESYVPQWTAKNKRFKNTLQTISLMENSARIPPITVGISTHLEGFIKEIISMSSELQKATPSYFSEKNKESINHLKSRKKKLFADTLKSLRVMGINYNLSSEIKLKQNSLSAVLTQLDYWEDFKCEGVEYYFHKSIDIIMRARKLNKDYSQDLNSAEVRRCTGFLEGLLQIIISHHNYLSALASSLKMLDLNLKMIKSMCAHDYGVRTSLKTTNLQQLLQWLPVVLKVGLDLIEIHSKFGRIESEVIINNFQSWIDLFANLEEQWNNLPRLPPRLISTKHLGLQNMIYDASQQLLIELTEIQETRPELESILKPIIPWTQIIISSADSTPEKLSISDLDSILSRLCDCVLVSIENCRKEISCFPNSFDEQGWFVKSITSFQKYLTAFQMKVVSRQIENAFTILTKLDLEDEHISQTASACLTVFLPILQQYQFICSEGFKRYASAHRATCKTSYILAKYFIQIATKGFCTPEKSDSQDEESYDLEGGTGLGDGEGAEDISKDVQGEDLDELAQESSANEKNEFVDEEDAVDMVDGELEGKFDETLNAEDKDDELSEEGENDDQVDEEAASVNDLDPGAIDEKMWDGENEETEDSQLNDKSKGKPSKDDLTSSKNDKNMLSDLDSVEEDDAHDEAASDEQEDEIIDNNADRNQSHMEEAETLELPDDMLLDGNDQMSGSEDKDEIDNLSALEDPEQDGEISSDEKDEEATDEGAHDSESRTCLDVNNDIDSEDNERNPEEAEDKISEAEDQPLEIETGEEFFPINKDDNVSSEEALLSDAQKGVGENKDNPNNHNSGSLSRENQDDNGQNQRSFEDGNGPSYQYQPADCNDSKDSGDDDENNATNKKGFQKLGEIFEEWHRQQAKNHDPSQQIQNLDTNNDKNISDLQHLQDENAIPDTQALGTATQDEACALDESMALETECQDSIEQFIPDEIKEEEVNRSGIVEFDEPHLSNSHNLDDSYKRDMGAMIGETRDYHIEYHNQVHGENIEEEIKEVDHQFKNNHNNSTDSLILSSRSRQIWTYYENLTHDLSLALTEQLRLILAPTLATKMRGDFRTGKRLNIKRIIPYIASQYKRDKIWMRRSKPSKRSYQVMLAIDDSRSMGENGSESLAFETLVMVSKSLSMLEVGEICIAGFGEDVRVAHEFEASFSSNTGPQILENFHFQQNRTDIALLVKKSIEIFRSARAKANHSTTDLWQLELIISDGICESRDHDKIRRLIREAFEERIMIVFVIMDDIKSKIDGQSVMELNQAMFLDGTVVTSRYLDSFPFQYYIIVREVRDLPSVLSTLIRQWFQETVEA